MPKKAKNYENGPKCDPKWPKRVSNVNQMVQIRPGIPSPNFLTKHGKILHKNGPKRDKMNKKGHKNDPKWSVMSKQMVQMRPEIPSPNILTKIMKNCQKIKKPLLKWPKHG